MKLFLISSLLFLTFMSTARADGGHPCDPYAPYYHRIETGPGALLADIFFFAFSAPVAVAVVGGSRRPVVNHRTKQRVRVSTAACLPISTARHFVQNRPPRAEQWGRDD